VVTVKVLFGFEVVVRGLIAISSWAKDVREGSYKGESVATDSMAQKGKMKIVSRPRGLWLLDAASVVMGIGPLVFSWTALCGLIVYLCFAMILSYLTCKGRIRNAVLTVVRH
jgi:hypothetical protein